jgi:predicted nucleic acid-binding protein
MDFAVLTSLLVFLQMNLPSQKKSNPNQAVFSIPSIVIGELFYGAEQSTERKTKKN